MLSYVCSSKYVYACIFEGCSICGSECLFLAYTFCLCRHAYLRLCTLVRISVCVYLFVLDFCEGYCLSGVILLTGFLCLSDFVSTKLTIASSVALLLGSAVFFIFVLVTVICTLATRQSFRVTAWRANLSTVQTCVKVPS